MVFEILDEGGDLGRGVGIGGRSGVFRFVNKTAGGRNEVFGPQGLVDGIEAVGRADHFGGMVAGGSDIVSACLEGGLEGGVGVGVFQKKDALAAKHPGDGVGAAEVAAVLGEEVTDFGGGAVFVVGLGFDDERGPARGIAFVGDLLDGAAAFQFPGAFLDGAVDVVDGHGFGAGGGDGGAESRIEAGIAPAEAGGNGDFLGQFGEEGAAFDVGSALGAFDFGPVAVAGHGSRLEIGRVRCRVGEIGDGRW